MDHTTRLPRLYAIADTATLERRGWQPAEAAEAWLEAGVRLIQLRHKGHFSREMFETAKLLSVLCRQAGAHFVVDDRADIARLLDAGCHVGQQDLSPADVRKVLGPALLLGFSTHNEAQLKAADAEPADYLAIGPIFATGSKQNPDPVVGLAGIPALRALTRKPLVAIGGIALDSAPALIRAGIDSIAVISDLLPAEKGRLRPRAEEWLQSLTNVL